MKLYFSLMSTIRIIRQKHTDTDTRVCTTVEAQRTIRLRTQQGYNYDRPLS